jgi:hypothetical protein
VEIHDVVTEIDHIIIVVADDSVTESPSSSLSLVGIGSVVRSIIVCAAPGPESSSLEGNCTASAMTLETTA